MLLHSNVITRIQIVSKVLSRIKNKTKTPLLLFVLYPEDITARNRPMFYVKTAAKEQAPKTGNLRLGGLTRNNVVN